MVLTVILIVFAIFILAGARPMTVHLYAGRVSAGRASRDFQKGVRELLEDVPIGARIIIHGPLTGTRAETLKM